MVKIIHLVMVNFRKPQQSGQGMVLGWQNQIKNDWYETVKVNYGIVLTVRRIFQSFQRDMIQNHTKYILNFGELKMFHPLDKISRYRIVLTAKGGIDMIWPRWFPMSFELYEFSSKNEEP
jgi:hypothetical protein